MALGIAVISGDVRQEGQTLPLPTDRLFQIGRHPGLDVTILSHNLNRYHCEIEVKDGVARIQQIGPWGYESSLGLHAVMSINGRMLLETSSGVACTRWTTSLSIDTRLKAIAAFKELTGPTPHYGCCNHSLWTPLDVGDEIQFCDDVALLRLVRLDS